MPARRPVLSVWLAAAVLDGTKQALPLTPGALQGRLVQTQEVGLLDQSRLRIQSSGCQATHPSSTKTPVPSISAQRCPDCRQIRGLMM